MAHRDDAWLEVVRAAFAAGQRIGAVGPGDIGEQIDHALALAALLPASASSGLDLGTGVGLPGLVLAATRPDMHWTLVDAAARRIAVAAEAIEELGWGHRVDAVHARAADLATDARWQGSIDVVVSRSFGPPATTAEEARPLLRVGGTLLVSEPPDAVTGARWPAETVATLGYAVSGRTMSPATQALTVVGPATRPLPRRDGVARKRPLW